MNSPQTAALARETAPATSPTMKDATQSSPRSGALAWGLQILVAVLVGQTLYFKFSGAPEAVALFTKLGVEPWGRFAVGTMELVTVLLLLRRKTAVLGALAAAGSMVGAIGLHLTVLGIEVEGDGGLLFGLAWAVLLASVGVVFLRRGELGLLGLLGR